MKLASLPTEFTAALPVIEAIESAGFVAYFVGGSVRDTLLQQPIHDVDIATSASPQEIKQIFRRTVDVGIEHGTVLVLFQQHQYEITTFRTEENYQDYRRPEKVTFVRSLSEDLNRRDFTINALALTQTGEVIDLFAGLADLRAGIIRAVGNPEERFHEDALRMMRALRFSSQLGFTIEVATLTAIKQHCGLLSKISVERVQVEFTKLLLGYNRQQALIDFVETGCYAYCPEFANQRERLLELANLPSLSFADEISAWTVTCHSLRILPEQVTHFLKRWKFSNQFCKAVQKCLMALELRLEHTWSAWSLYQCGYATAQRAERLLPFFAQSAHLSELQTLELKLPIHHLNDLLVNGAELVQSLKEKPGPWVGTLLRYLEQEVVEQRIGNEKTVLLATAKKKFEEEFR